MKSLSHGATLAPRWAVADPNCTYPRCLTEGCDKMCRTVKPATAWPRIEDAIECLEGQLFHPSASHINPDYRDGWNRATNAALTLLRMVASEPVSVWRTPDGTCRCTRCSGPLTAMSASCPHARAVKRTAGVLATTGRDYSSQTPMDSEKGGKEL